VPPYVVFHDSTLREMAKARPTSLSALLHVPGVGARKAEDFGQQFLDAIAGHGA
jgi:ATP-dependent DNA helicase RecQ